MIFRPYRIPHITVYLFGAFFGIGVVGAQQPDNNVAKLKDLEGNVLVSQQDAFVAGANDRRLPVGTRVVTMAGAKVTISYDFGCDVRLKENERYTVTMGPCAFLLTQVEALGPAAGAIGGGTAGAVAGGTGVAGVVVGGIITGIGIYELTRNNNVSPH